MLLGAGDHEALGHPVLALPAHAVAATVNAWDSRSGDSTPQVSLMTRLRRSVAMGGGYDRLVEAFYIALLIASALVITWFAVYVVYRLVRTPR